jgi:glycyl-tRNA synthetase beta chain
MGAKPLLLEIGTEEIPARFLPGAVENILSLADSVIRKESRVVINGEKSFATPRRLVLCIEHVDEWEMKDSISTLGPPKDIAIDPDGNYTKAALGFARKAGVEPGDLRIKKTERGEYLEAVKEEGGGRTEDLLPELLKKIILSIHFPKSMRWGDGTLRFARPIQWILALYGEETVEFDLDGIRSGNTTRGHRFLSPEEFVIGDALEYVSMLKVRHVVVDVEERAGIIRKQFADLCGSVSGIPVEDDELLSTVSCLVEYPECVLGTFEEKYLELPEELLTAVMRGHQKYFSVKDKSGKMKNNFVIVSNTDKENADTVRAGAERVIRARFDDARFYFEEDSKTPLADRAGELRGVTFQDRLGTLYDKTMRLSDITSELAGRLCPSERDKCSRAAYLSKADLVSGVVFEFPELQGIMGMHYARNDGESEEVVQAIREHYLPAFSGDRLPDTDVGAVVSLADRIDTIAAFFSIGLKPTGSEDPFALRRHALAAIAILSGKGYRISISDLLSCGIKRASGTEGNDPRIAVHKDVKLEILDFFSQRVEHLLSSKGYEYDLVQSVSPFFTKVPLKDLYSRLEALQEFKNNARYNEFLTAAKRVGNILAPVLKSGEEFAAVDDGLFMTGDERSLNDACVKVEGLLDIDVDVEIDCSGAIDSLMSLTDPITGFFDNVLVMDKDEAVRRNRLAILKEVWDMFSCIADFSRLQEVS